MRRVFGQAVQASRVPGQPGGAQEWVTSPVSRLYIQLTQVIVDLPTFMDGLLTGAIRLGRKGCSPLPLGPIRCNSLLAGHLRP
jgi:hypothetical protein